MRVYHGMGERSEEKSKRENGIFELCEWFDEGITHVEVYRDYEDPERFTGEYIVVAPYQSEE